LLLIFVLDIQALCQIGSVALAKKLLQLKTFLLGLIP
jgi:hypothetical protein